MPDFVKLATDELYQAVMDSLGRLVEAGKLEPLPLPSFKIEIPADKSHGDFAANAAMAFAKTLKMPPRKIAELISENLVLDGTYFNKVEIAGPGFINFFLAPVWFADAVSAVIEYKNDYGKTSMGNGKRILLEFVSANPTGPMHIGNARGGAIGDCLASILSVAGYDVQREFYVNDAGNQIEKFALSLEIRYLQLFKDNIEMPEDAYHGADIIEHAKAFAEQYGNLYADCESELRRKMLVEFALPKNISALEKDLLKYRIKYDNWFMESSLHNNGDVDKIIQLFKEKGCTYELDGALWFKASEFGADKDFVLVRSNGIPTYVVPDIAYHYNKLVIRNYDKAIDILGADHHGYVPRLKAALTALDVDADKLDVIIMQMVRLVRNGELVKVSKRSGKAITLVTLLDEISVDAARFYFNLREANSHFEFDLDLAVEKSSQNPVYYVQYAHARICSLIRNLEEDGFSVSDTDADSTLIYEDSHEKELVRHIAMLPGEINASAKLYDPSRITKYAVELATLFHKFYDACSVKNAETAELKKSRLILCHAARQILRNVLSILKIDSPEKM